GDHVVPMTLSMAVSEPIASRCGNEDVLSTELVLIDPLLRAAAQERVPAVPGRIPRAVSTADPPRTNGHERFVTLAKAVDTADRSKPSHRDRRSRSWRGVAGVASVTILGLLLVDMHVP